MTQFNPENKENATYGDLLGPAMEIIDPEDAKQYKAAYVDFIKKNLKPEDNPTGASAEEIANKNLGYWAGYYGNDVRERVEKLFNCAHPVFGSIAEKGVPTSQEAFLMGQKIASKKKS